MIHWEDRNEFGSTILINATPIGMKGVEDLTLIRTESFKNFAKVMDVVVREEDTLLIKQAKSNSMPYVSGLYMTFFQAARQYKIYTSLDAPVGQMLKAYNKKFDKCVTL